MSVNDNERLQAHNSALRTTRACASAGVAWSAGGQTLVCADPRTGRVRASYPLNYRAGLSSPVAPHDRLYSIFGYGPGGGAALVRMTHPQPAI